MIFAISSASLNPCAPVHALALPELTTNACTRLCCRCRWSITTDADLTLFVVNTPPVSQTRSDCTTHRSFCCPEGIAVAPAVNALIPHDAVPATKPRGKVTATG